MAACKMISHINLSLKNIFYFQCVCILSLSYLEGGVSLSIKAWERCIKFSFSIPILIISGLIKLVPSFILVT